MSQGSTLAFYFTPLALLGKNQCQNRPHSLEYVEKEYPESGVPRIRYGHPSGYTMVGSFHVPLQARRPKYRCQICHGHTRQQLIVGPELCELCREARFPDRRGSSVEVGPFKTEAEFGILMSGSHVLSR